MHNPIPSKLQDLAAECQAAHAKALSANKDKLIYLTERNFLRSKMIWQYGLIMTRTALSYVGAAQLIDGAASTDLKASVECCIDYEEKAIDAAEQHKEDEAREYIEARDFLLSKIVWQYGAKMICDIFQELGHNPIDRKKLIRILRDPIPSRFDQLAAKVNRKEQQFDEAKYSTGQLQIASAEDAKLLELIRQINRI